MYQDQREPLFRFLAGGKEFHSGNGVGGPGQACAVAREAARQKPGIEHTVHHRDGRFLAAYKLVGTKLLVRMA